MGIHHRVRSGPPRPAAASRQRYGDGVAGRHVPDPPEYKWYRIPAELLHSDLEVVYVNFAAFMEAHSHIFRGPREPAARVDDRPLITAQWREQHPDEWQRLWDQQARNECPVCHE